MSEELMIKVEHLSKEYKLGQIGGTTLKEELQRKWARIRKKDDPTRKIGSKEYIKGDVFKAINDVSFEITRGERVGIIGKNGAGKSTLLKLISRVTGPTSGEIGLNGRITSMLEVGTGFHPELTGRENIYMNGAILGMTKKEIDNVIEKIIDFSEVHQFIDTPVKRYSSGMFVKLAFSVAAHLKSEIMIMDEVLAVGDMQFQEKCLKKMNEVSNDEGRTILYVSHNMNTIRKLCNRCIVLDHGSIVYDGDVEVAVAKYLECDNVGIIEREYDVSRYAEWIQKRYLKVTKAQFLDVDSNVFSNTRRLKIKLNWDNLVSYNNLSLRFEISSVENGPVATFFLNDCLSGITGESQSYSFSLDISQFQNGKYSMIYTFFYLDGNNRSQNVEIVDGLDFEIQNENDSIIWEANHWGGIKLLGVEVLSDDSHLE